MVPNTWRRSARNRRSVTTINPADGFFAPGAHKAQSQPPPLTPPRNQRETRRRAPYGGAATRGGAASCGIDLVMSGIVWGGGIGPAILRGAFIVPTSIVPRSSASPAMRNWVRRRSQPVRDRLRKAHSAPLGALLAPALAGRCAQSRVAASCSRRTEELADRQRPEAKEAEKRAKSFVAAQGDSIVPRGRTPGHVRQRSVLRLAASSRRRWSARPLPCRRSSRAPPRFCRRHPRPLPADRRRRRRPLDRLARGDGAHRRRPRRGAGRRPRRDDRAAGGTRGRRCARRRGRRQPRQVGVLAIVSHEVRTPLIGIWMADRFRDTPLTPEQ